MQQVRMRWYGYEWISTQEDWPRGCTAQDVIHDCEMDISAGTVPEAESECRPGELYLSGIIFHPVDRPDDDELFEDLTSNLQSADTCERPTFS